jgi:hypothetical protein
MSFFMQKKKSEVSISNSNNISLQPEKTTFFLTKNRITEISK